MGALIYIHFRGSARHHFRGSARCRFNENEKRSRRRDRRCQHHSDAAEFGDPGVFIPLLGVGKIPAIVALFFYSVLPILRNTYTGVKGVNQNLLESGKGIGMTAWEQIRLVELPLSVPVIMAGIRTSTVYLIGWATLSAFIGGGGLGDYIFIGLNLYQPEYIIAGAVPVTILAIVIDYILSKTEDKVTPQGLKGMKEVS